MRNWRPYQRGEWRLGRLKGEAVAVRWIAGRRVNRIRLGVRTEREGRAKLDEHVRSLTAITAKREELAVAEIWTRYLEDRETDGKLTDVMRYQWRALAPVFGGLVPDEITVPLCRSYAKRRFALGRAPATVHTELIKLRTALQWAEKRRVIDRAPYVWAPSPGKPRARVLDRAEALTLLEAAGEAPLHVYTFVALAFGTGARKSALLELAWARVDFGAGEIDLHDPGDRDPMSKRGQKGRAIVPMNSLARAALAAARQVAVTPYVIEYNGRRIERIDKAFRALVARTGLKDVTPHVIRHTVATWANAEGLDSSQIAAFLGHSDKRTTERVYIKRQAGMASGVAEVVDLPVLRKVKG